MELSVKKRNGRLVPLDVNKINKSVERACEGLERVSISEIVLDAQLQLFDKITTKEIDSALILSARSKVDKEPNYSLAAARLLLNTIYKEVWGEGVDSDMFEAQYHKSFVTNLKALIKQGRLDPKLGQLFDLKALAGYIRPERDQLFKCMGIQILYDRYFQHYEGRRLESPQAFWMRVAMGLALAEKEDHTLWAQRFYDVLSQMLIVPSTPTLFNAGTTSPQLSSCYLSDFGDSIHGIFRGIHQQAMLSKHAGGLGVAFSKIRATGAFIKKTNGISGGVIPWIKIMCDTAIAVNQAGLRKGACAVYLQTEHADVEDYLDLRKPVGDERRRTLDLNTVNWIPDLFMKRVQNGGMWSLFCPSEAPELVELYGKAFEDKYLEYEGRGLEGELRVFKRIPAKDLWKKMLGAQMQFGGPWQTFKDTINMRNPIAHVGPIHSSNLCCVAGDQRAPTQWGLLTVRELVALGKALRVPGRTQIQSASRMQLTIKNSPLVMVTTREGYTHKVTPDHPLWVHNRGWIEAQHLTAGDLVETQQIEGEWGTKHFPEEAFVMGMVAGDGTYGESDTSVCVDLWESDFDLIPELELCASNIITRNRPTQRTNAKRIPQFAPDGAKRRMNSTMLGQSLQSFGMKKGTKVSVPSTVWEADRETVCEFLRGVFITDGTVQYDDGKTKVCSFSLTSTHREFLSDLQIILANFGVRSMVTIHDAGGIRSLPDGKGSYASYVCNEKWRLLVTCRRDCLVLESLTGIFSRKGFKIASTKAIYNPKKVATVLSVTKLPNEDTYCLMVDSDERAWVCNGLVTKNTEVTLPTRPSSYNEVTGNTEEEGLTAVCNITNINLSKFVKDGKIDQAALRDIIPWAVRMLDNVIDVNYYPVPEARKANMYTRPVILSQMGWHDMLLALNVNYNSRDMVNLAGALEQFIYYHAISASCELAAERGAFPAFQGSAWSEGKFAQDLYEDWCAEMGREPRFLNLQSPHIDTQSLNWDELRTRVMMRGVRNANLTCNAPTATVSYVAGASQSFEPYFQVIYTYSTLSGEILSVCTAFYDECRERGLMSPELIQELRSANGDVALCTLLPDDIKEKYASPYNIPYEVMIDANAARQVYVDQAQSFNLFSKTQSLKYHNDMFMYAWESGCKTTYYLRSKAATQIKTLEEKVQNNTQDVAMLREIEENAKNIALRAQDEIMSRIHPEMVTVMSEEEHSARGAKLMAELDAQEQTRLACSIANPEACEACQS